jgi:hypothetical protein
VIRPRRTRAQVPGAADQGRQAHAFGWRQGAASIARLQAGGGEVKLFSALKKQGWTRRPSCSGAGRIRGEAPAEHGLRVTTAPPALSRKCITKRRQPVIETFRAAAQRHHHSVAARPAPDARVVFRHGFPRPPSSGTNCWNTFAARARRFRCIAQPAAASGNRGSPTEGGLPRPPACRTSPQLAASENPDGKIQVLVARLGRRVRGLCQPPRRQTRQARDHQLPHPEPSRASC